MKEPTLRELRKFGKFSSLFVAEGGGFCCFFRAYGSGGDYETHRLACDAINAYAKTNATDIEHVSVHVPNISERLCASPAVTVCDAEIAAEDYATWYAWDAAQNAQGEC